MSALYAYTLATNAVASGEEAARRLTNLRILMADFPQYAGSDDERSASEKACQIAGDSARYWNRFCDLVEP